MRALVGALAGLIVGILLFAGLSIVLKPNVPWAVLIVGLIAGFVMRKLTAGDPGSKYLRGGLAAVVTALATIIGPLVATEWFRYQTSTIKPVAVAEASDVESSDTPAEQANETDAELPKETFATGANAPRGLTLSEQNSTSFNGVEMACMAIGCLLAYSVGKGESAATVTSTEGDPEAEANETDEADSPVEKDV